MLLLESRGPGLVQRQSSPAWTSSRFSKLSERTMKPSLASSRANPNSRLGGLQREVLKAALERVGVETTSWNLVFEFELPFEGGR